MPEDKSQMTNQIITALVAACFSGFGLLLFTIIEKVDDIGTRQDQAMEYVNQLEINIKILSDHEERIRLLEHEADK